MEMDIPLTDLFECPSCGAYCPYCGGTGKSSDGDKGVKVCSQCGEFGGLRRKRFTPDRMGH